MNYIAAMTDSRRNPRDFFNWTRLNNISFQVPDPYKHGVFLVGHRRTVGTLRPICDFYVCLEEPQWKTIYNKDV